MRILKHKGFRALVITKKSIVFTLCILFLITSGLVLLTKKSEKNNEIQITSSDSMDKMILSSGLHSESYTKESAKKIIEQLIGFDIENPTSILYEYSPQFYEIKSHTALDNLTYPKPEQTKNTTATKEEKPIEEINSAKGLAISNSTKMQVNPQSLAKENLSFSFDGNGPQILVIHTHTTESYTDSNSDSYYSTQSDRTTDETKNVVAVGNALCEVLEANGIKVIHDTTVHDYPAYNGSYDRCKATTLKNLDKYPSIKMVLDIHRDAIARSDGTKVKVVCEIDGEKCAQCMFVVGSNANLTHNKWQENLKLACKLQNMANEMYPDLMRAINLREERFNQQLSTGSLIIEVGTNGNTLSEAVNGAKHMGEVIAAVLG